MNMASTEVMRAVEASAFERDQQEFALGDTLDIKTGLILAGLTFLAILTGDLMKSTGISHSEVWAVVTRHSPITFACVQWAAQFVSVLALIVGGIYSVRVLIPRDYDREPTPSTYMGWVRDTETYREQYPEAAAEPVTVERLIAKRLENVTANIQNNLALNERKSDWMFVAFWSMAASFGANLLTLAMRLF
jgi:hypothetical protein